MVLILRIIIADTWNKWFGKSVGPDVVVFDIELLEKYKRGE